MNAPTTYSDENPIKVNVKIKSGGRAWRPGSAPN